MKVSWPEDETVDGPSCPVCDQPGPHAVALRTAGPDHTLVRCAHCTACFFPGQQPPDYAQDTPAELFVQLYVEQNGGLHHMTRPLWELDAAAHGIDSLLDVGCGFGFPVDAASRALGWRAVGVDPSFYADAGREMLGADIRRCYMTEATDVGPPAGLVLASEVIEHIPNLYPFMALLRRHLAPGGVLVMSTPDADSLTPAMDGGTLIPMLSVGAHLVLFTAPAMDQFLRRAGFQHVVCRVEAQSLLVYASDTPIVFRENAAAAHAAGYAQYLRSLLDSAQPGSTLWNGAAGRLLAILAENGSVADGFALYAGIAAAWRERFGIDLLRQRLPPLLDEQSFAVTGPVLIDRLRAEAPLNLGAVLYYRMVLERRLPVSTPESVLAHARITMLYAAQSYRALRDYGMVDFHLRDCAWQARLVVLDQFITLVPEMEPVLLAALVHPSPGVLAGWADPPRPIVVARVAPVFSRLVHEARYDEALRLAPALEDLDLVTGALAGTPMVLFHALFCVGVLQLNHLGAAEGAREAFGRMQAEAAARLGGPADDVARHFLPVAEAHLLMTPASAIAPPVPRRKRRA